LETQNKWLVYIIVYARQRGYTGRCPISYENTETRATSTLTGLAEVKPLLSDNGTRMDNDVIRYPKSKMQSIKLRGALLKKQRAVIFSSYH
jgi:hypothetical protein